MKALVILVLNLAVTSAFACPDLSGSYKCEPLNVGLDSGNVRISVEDNVYSVDESDNGYPMGFVADGKPHQIPYGYNYTCSCTDTALVCEATDVGATYQAKLEYGFTPENKFYRKGSTRQHIGGPEDYQESYTQTCETLSK